MCGRYSLYTKKDALMERFHAEMADDLGPNYNASPSQHMPIIISENPEAIVFGHWGFLPKWAEGNKKIKAMINARAETARVKPFFREAFKKYRCLILADGFYEWQRTEKEKIPYRFSLKSGEPFAMAGIYSEIEDEEGGRIPSYAILTTGANSIMAPVHNRMPVILNHGNEDGWLDPSLEIEKLESLLVPYRGEDFSAYVVSKKVNSPANNSKDLILAV